MRRLIFIALFFLSVGALFASRINLVTGGGSAPTVLTLDNFVDTDNTVLQSHTQDTGSGWNNPIVGSCQINSNTMNCTGGNNVYTTSEGGSNWFVTVTATLNLSLSDSEVHLYSNDSGSSFYELFVQPNINKITITDSGTTVVTTSAYTFSSGVQTWKFIVSPTTGFDFQVNGSSKLSSAYSLTSYGVLTAFQIVPHGTTFSQYKVTVP